MITAQNTLVELKIFSINLFFMDFLTGIDGGLVYRNSINMDDQMFR